MSYFRKKLYLLAVIIGVALLLDSQPVIKLLSSAGLTSEQVGMGLVAVFLLFVLIFALKNGGINYRFQRVKRADSPVAYWITLTVIFFMFALISVYLFYPSLLTAIL